MTNTSTAVPTLKPYQPKARISVPSTANVIECPGMTFTDPSSPYRSIRGPSTHAAVSPAMPPMPWTIIPPAKSW